ncbi:hypothetical protein BDV19DRAFT_384979 [Aspergillus venezuelensis]
MGFFVVLGLLLCSVLVRASAPSLHFPEPRRLSAGTLLSKLEAREFTSALLNEATSFDYISDDVEDESVFSTTLDVKSQWSILALEDLDAGLESVSCTDSEIRLDFASIAAEKRFRAAVKDTPEFIVVTSHDGCDLDGERSAHLVTGVSVSNEDGTIALTMDRMDWHDAFSSTTVSFRRRHPSEIQRRSPTLVKRQTETQPSASTSSFPAAPTSAAGLNSSADASFNARHTDMKIYPSDSTLVQEVVPQVPIVVTCKTCTLEGDIELSQGQFSVGSDVDADSDSSDIMLTEAISFFQNSSVELLVKQLSSQIELEFELESEGPLLEVTAALPSIGLTPFQIAGVITFGPQIVPNFVFTADLEGDVGFSYGFNVKVPDNSRVSIKIPDFDESSITGFEDTTFETIPFEPTTEVLSVSLSVAFRPQILLGISTALDDLIRMEIDGGIGAFVSLPNLSLNASQVTGVNEDCEAAGEDDVVGNAIRLTPSVELDMGVIASYDVRLGSFNDSREIAPVLASTSYSLPTGCVNFEADVETNDRTGSLASEGRGSSGSGGSDDDGGNGAVSARGGSGLSITLICAVVLSTVAVGFCSWG